VRLHQETEKLRYDVAMDEQTELLREIRDLLKVLASPMLAERDKEGRRVLRELVGKSDKRKAFVLAIDGKRPRAELVKETGIDPADASRIVADLKDQKILTESNRVPKFQISVDPGIFTGVPNVR